MTALTLAPTEKACRECGVIKPIDAFARKGKYRAARCKDCLRAWAARYREEHGDRVRANERAGYARNPARKRTNAVAYYHRHREAVTRRARERYARLYPVTPELWLAANARRKQRLKVAMDAMDRAMSVAYRRAIRPDGCTYCGGRVEGDMHVDHYFPLVHGGTDHWWNLAQSCGPCNRHKHDRCGTWMHLRVGVSR